MIEQIDRLEAENQRRVAMLLEDHSRRECGLEAMRHPRPDHTTKAAERLTACLDVVRQVVEPLLDGAGRPETRHYALLRRGEGQIRRIGRVSAGERESL